MTYHIRLKDYYCPNCSGHYLPFKSDLPCPHCGKTNKIEDLEYLEAIPSILNSMHAHKLKYGRYLPDAWYQGSYIEYIQSGAFLFFDRYEKNKKLGFESVIDDCLKNEKDIPTWEKRHLKEIMMAVFAVYKENPNISKPSFFRRWLARLLP